MKVKSRGYHLLMALSFLGLLCLVALIPAAFFMLAWNYVVPKLFNGPEISFWQAFALGILLSFVRSAVHTQKSE